MNLTIREAGEADIPARVAVLNAVFPEHLQTAASVTHFLHELRDSGLKPHFAAWVAEEAGQMVAAAQVWQAPWMFHADRYHAELAVHPAQREVVNQGGEYWSQLLAFGKSIGKLAPKDAGILQACASIPSRIPTEKQCVAAVAIADKLEQYYQTA